MSPTPDKLPLDPFGPKECAKQMETIYGKEVFGLADLITSMAFHRKLSEETVQTLPMNPEDDTHLQSYQRTWVFLSGVRTAQAYPEERKELATSLLEYIDYSGLRDKVITAAIDVAEQYGRLRLTEFVNSIFK